MPEISGCISNQRNSGLDWENAAVAGIDAESAVSVSMVDLHDAPGAAQAIVRLGAAPTLDSHIDCVLVGEAHQRCCFCV